MENKINFLKAKPLITSLIILLVAVIIFTVFQLYDLRKSQKISHPSEVVKEEFLPVAETKLQPEEKPVPVLQKKFTIQVASFQETTRAEKVSKDLKENGYQPVISAMALPLKVSGRPILLDKELPEKGTWYRVFVGDFDNEEAAKELLNTLKEAYKDSFIKLR